MTPVLLDTTFLIDAERGTDLGMLLDDDDDVAIAAISIAELRVGVLLAERRHRAARAAFLDELVAAVPVLAYDLRVAQVHGELLAAVREQGRPRGAHDLIIAATARAANRTVVTADARAFTDLPDVAVRPH